jgi:hypothetical protein
LALIVILITQSGMLPVHCLVGGAATFFAQLYYTEGYTEWTVPPCQTLMFGRGRESRTLAAPAPVCGSFLMLQSMQLILLACSGLRLSSSLEIVAILIGHSGIFPGYSIHHHHPASIINTVCCNFSLFWQQYSAGMQLLR